MLQQGSGGAYEVSQRFTAMVGWAATAEVDNFVFDQAAERYALDEEVAKKLQKNNPGETKFLHVVIEYPSSSRCSSYRGIQECCSPTIRGKWYVGTSAHYFICTFFTDLLFSGRGMWDTDEDTLDKLRNLYSDADDLIEQVASSFG
jgi:magnesium chelatase subunit H